MVRPPEGGRTALVLRFHCVIAHEHGGNLRSRGAGLRGKRIVADAVDDPGAHRPADGLDRPLGQVQHVGKAGERGRLADRGPDALVPGIAAENRCCSRVSWSVGPKESAS